MVKFVILATTLAFSSTAALACEQQNDAERLACYDKAAGFTPRVAEQVSLTQADLLKVFTSDSTQVSREAGFAPFKGREVSFTGKVREVEAPGWLIKEYRVILKADNLTAYCYVQPTDTHAVASLRSNSKFTCIGSLKGYSELFGLYSVDIQRFLG